MRKLLLPFFLVAITATFAQSPWTQKKGKAYTQIAFTSIPSYNTLFGNPDQSLLGEISDNTIQLYAAYGISDKTTFIINLPYKSVSYKENLVCITAPCPTINHKKSSLGNIELGVKHLFYKKDWVFSGQINIEARTNSFDNDSGIRTGYDAWSFTPLLLVGKSFKKAYFQSFFGANIKTNNYSSSIKIGGEYGNKITKKIWLIGFLDVVKSFKNGSIILPNSNLLTGLYVNDQEYGAFGVKVIGEFSKSVGVTGGFGSAFFGNNVAKQAALTIGLYHKL